ncbi:MAG TPA: hypothetical protein PK233_05315, partial [Candidatus Atribacteria bacterium]|nr:hypothetical protein [Candidatus Atribacteria bacterium]
PLHILLLFSIIPAWLRITGAKSTYRSLFCCRNDTPSPSFLSVSIDYEGASPLITPKKIKRRSKNLKTQDY